MANILKPCSQIGTFGSSETHTSLKMAAIADVKEKQASEQNSGPSLWIKIHVFQQGLITFFIVKKLIKKPTTNTHSLEV